MSNSKTIAGIELGTDYIKVIVGEIVDSKNLRTLSGAKEKCSGIKKADIIDAYKVKVATELAINKADKKINVKDACLAISGSYIKGFRTEGSASVYGVDSLVRKNDVYRASQDAQGKSLPDDRTYINASCCGYYLDTQEEICKDPIGLKANRIAAEYWMQHTDKEVLDEFFTIIESLGLHVKYLLPSSIASALAVSTLEQRNNGVLVIDIGKGTSDYAIYNKDKIIQAGVIPIGGDHLDNDIAQGLNLSKDKARQLKEKCSKLIVEPQDKHEFIPKEGDNQIGDRNIPLTALIKIMNVRIVELFEFIKNEINEHLENEDIKEVILTGGTSRLNGITQISESILGLSTTKTSQQKNLNPRYKNPEYSTVVGLLEHSLVQEQKEVQKKSQTSILRKIKDWIGA